MADFNACCDHCKVMFVYKKQKTNIFSRCMCKNDESYVFQCPLCSSMNSVRMVKNNKNKSKKNK